MSLGKVKVIEVPWIEYREHIFSELHKGACTLCKICGEPEWNDREHLCWEVQTEGYPAHRVGEELKRWQR